MQVDAGVALWGQPAGRPDEAPEADAGALPTEPQGDAPVLVAVGEDAVGDPRLDEQPDAVVLENPCAVGVLDRLDGAVVEHHGLDAREVEQVAQHEPGRPAADDRDLCAARRHETHPGRTAQRRPSERELDAPERRYVDSGDMTSS